jgi:hypothetical protein
LVGQNENLSWANKDVSRKLFEANQRGRQLAVTLGFSDIFEAETVISRNPGAFNHFGIEHQVLRSRQLERKLEEQQQIYSELQKVHQGALQTFQRVKEDNDVLRVELKRLQDGMSRNTKLNRCVWFTNCFLTDVKFSALLSKIYQPHLTVPPLHPSFKHSRAYPLSIPLDTPWNLTIPSRMRLLYDLN